MKTSSLPTVTANIMCGLQEGYEGPLHPSSDAAAIARSYCDAVGLGVTVTDTQFVYTGGQEPGVIVGLINYPRFPSDRETVLKHALALAVKLMLGLGQLRCTVVTDHETFCIEND
jgi:hypothetical protein